MRPRRVIVSMLAGVTLIGGAFAVSASAATKSEALPDCPSVTIQPSNGDYWVDCSLGTPSNGEGGGVNFTDESGTPVQVEGNALVCNTSLTGKYHCVGAAQFVDPFTGDSDTLVCDWLSCTNVRP